MPVTFIAGSRPATPAPGSGHGRIPLHPASVASAGRRIATVIPLHRWRMVGAGRGDPEAPCPRPVVRGARDDQLHPDL
jgi:hypothetical protein